MHPYSREQLILSRAVGKKLAEVFVKPPDEEPSLPHAKAYIALGGVVFTAGASLELVLLPDYLAFDKALVAGGGYVLCRGLVEYIKTLN